MSFKKYFVLALTALSMIMGDAFAETLPVVVRPPFEGSQENVLLINGIRQAITAELIKKSLDSELFWKNFEEKTKEQSNEKKLNEEAELALFRPIFLQVSVAIDAPSAVTPGAAPPPDQFLRGVLTYEFEPQKSKVFFDEILTGLPDPSIKTFYVLPEINIANDMLWSDVGVSKKENFSGVIIDSWKNWAVAQFKVFPNVVILEKDFTAIPQGINPESVILKWNSNLKKNQSFQDRKSASYELNAQYVLVNAKTKQNLVAFDFPLQKRELDTSNPKDLSSNLASLIYNLLNSQAAKITTALEVNRTSSAMNVIEVKVIGKHGLYDITQINNLLIERFKSISLTSSLKSYSSSLSLLSLKSSLDESALFANFAKDGGKFPLNEQKILLFSPESKTFAIIPKEANN